MRDTISWLLLSRTVYPKKCAHGFVVLCFVVVMQSFIMNSYEVFIHIHQGCFAGTGAIVRLPQCQWSKPDGYGKISQCITTTKHSKAKTACIFLGIYCILHWPRTCSCVTRQTRRQITPFASDWYRAYVICDHKSKMDFGVGSLLPYIYVTHFKTPHTNVNQNFVVHLRASDS